MHDFPQRTTAARPAAAAAQKIKAGLDGDGRLVALNQDVVSAWPTTHTPLRMSQMPEVAVSAIANGEKVPASAKRR
jgi:hypothetical protein